MLSGDPAGLVPDSPLSLVRRRGRRAVLSLIGSMLSTAIVIAALQPLELETSSKVAPLLFLIPVIAISATSGVLWGVVTSLLAFAAINYFFTPTVRGFRVPEASDVVALGVFLLVAFGLARIMSRQREARDAGDLTARRLAFLAGANEMLQRASLDYERTLNELASLSVPGIADWCTIDVRQRDGRLRTLAIAYGDRVRGPLAENLAHQNQPNPEAPAGIASVTRTGRPELYPVVTDETIHHFARDPQHAALLRGLNLRSLIIVPLFVRGQPIGAVKFASVRSDRRYGPEDLTLAQDLALRAGTALENVRLYQMRTREARILQQSLLPATLPTIDGIEVVARFEPFGDGDLVGGDFYDVFAAPGDRWLAVVGDVCGKGVEAAALTGLARHTLRALAMRGEKPREMLLALNDAILSSQQENFCTVGLASIAFNGSWADVTLIRAGHPAPILVRANGEASLIGPDGALLGALAEPTLEETRFRLNDGDSLILYTDGMLDEYADDPEGGLLALVEGVEKAHAKEIADRLSDGVHGPNSSNDDRAFLVLTLNCVNGKGPGAPWI